MKEKKRLFSMAVVLVMLASMFTGINVSVSAAEPFEYDFFEDGWVQKSDLNPAASVYASVVDLGGERGEVIKINEGYTNLPVSSWAFDDRLQGTTVVFSFKFMSELISASSTGNTFAEMYVKDGRTSTIEFDNSNNWPGFTTRPNGDFTYYAQDWALETENVLEAHGESMKWYQIDSVYDLTNGKVKHYVDGTYLGESSDGPTFLDYIMLVPSMDRGDGTRPGCNVYYDDVTLKEVGTGVAASVDIANSGEERVVVKFNEPIAQDDASKIKLVDSETLEEVVCTAEKLDELTYALVGNGFKLGGEYRLKLPAATGAYGNTLKEETIFFNLLDPTMVVESGGDSVNEDEVLFTDNFDDYEVMTYPEVAGNATTADTTKWSIPNVAWEGYGITILSDDNENKYLNIRPKQQGDAAGLQAKALLGETVTSGVTEIYFEAALQNPEANDSIMQAADSDKQSVNFVEILLGKDGVAENYPVMTIRRSDIAMYQNGGYGTDVVSGYTNSNDKTQLNKYKLTVDMDNDAVTLAIHNGTSYETVKTTTILASTLGTNGYDKLIFSHYKSASSGALDADTMSVFDNVTIVKKAEEVEATFDDNFSSYVVMANPGATDTFTIIDGAKWTKRGACTWGMGPYISTVNNNKLLKIDLWQSTSAETRQAVTVLGEENFTKGEINVTFDASAQNPEANGDISSFFTFGMTDGIRRDIYPIFDINREDIITYTSADYGTGVVNETYKAANDITQMNSFKVSVNFDTGKVITYILDGEEYVQICDATMTDTFRKNGLQNFVFQGYKVASSGALSGGTDGVEDDTSVAVDNVKINYDKELPLPVVKSVRIEGAPTSENVPTVSKNIKIYFNKAMDESTLGEIKVTGAEHGEGVYSSTDNSYTITLTSNLTSLTAYSVNVPQSVMDTDGYPLDRPYSGVFTTAEGEIDILSDEIKANDETLADGDLADLAAGTDIYYDVQLRNSSSKTASARVILAAYAEKKLVAIDTKAATDIEPGATLSLAASVKMADNITKVKGYAWDMSANKPLNYYKVITDGFRIRLLGRYEETTDGYSLNWPNSGIEFTFSGTEASVYLNKVTGTAYFTPYVDGVAQDRVVAKAGWTTIASGLDSGTHTIKFVRSSEARQGRVWMTKIDANDAEATDGKDRLIEFYGDSYTAGYGNLAIPNGGGDAANSDAQKAYSVVIADHFNADANLIAYSGKGMVKNGSATDTNMNMPTMSKYADIVVNGDTVMPSEWDFTKKTPDLVIIFLGTNDNSAGVGSDEFKSAYMSFVETTRGRYGDVKILCLAKASGSMGDEVESVVTQLKAAGDKNIAYYEFSKFGNSGGHSHPSAAEDIEIANELKTPISALMGW